MDNFVNEENNIEVNLSSDSQLTSSDNTTSDNNVRNRVSSWLTDIVGEVRKKGASVSIPKWVDTPSSGNSFQSSDSSNGKKTECDNLIAQKVANINLNENFEENLNDNNLIENLEIQNTCEVEVESNIPSRFWNKFTFDRSLSNQNQTGSNTINTSDKVLQIKTFGKTKFNEIYEKVKISKEKFPILRKSPTTMDENLAVKEIKSVKEEIKRIEEIIVDTTIENETKPLNANEKVTEPNENITDKFEGDKEILSNTYFEENANINLRDKQTIPKDELKMEFNDSNDNMGSFKKFKRNLKLVDLGRSSTLNPKYLCDDDNDDLKYKFPTSSLSVTPIEEEEEISPLISSTPSSKSKRYLQFSAICRSFSEQQPDVIDESEELLNERSHSCYHVVENSENKKIKTENEEKGVNIIKNSDNKKDGKSHISTSLPSFPTTNMMKHLKSSRKPDINSYGDSSSSICMDISPCGSGSGTSSSEPRDLILRRKSTFIRDNSYQSDSSHCSSVDSLLESRKPDPESILINLGFGPIDSEDILAKIPKRFLKPSQVRGIDTEAFLRRQQLMNSIHDHSVLGYRGLLGNPDIPPSVIVAKIMERFEQNEINRWNFYEYNRPLSAPPNSMEIQKFQYNT